ncbi:MAG: ChrR family anti-sigma-E factor [Pseudomonadota bacterium]
MNQPSHHIPEELIQAYVCGMLPHAYSVVVAAHISVCDECRTRMETLEAVGGAAVDTLAPIALSDSFKDRVMGLLDAEMPVMEKPKPKGIFPGPIMAELDGSPPRWRSLGGGIRQQVLNEGEDGTLRLIYIPSGMAVPEHSHRGMELTMVLQGSYNDVEGEFKAGDVEVAAEVTNHTPIAGPGEPCICVTATDAPLRFSAWLPRLLQPVFRI